MQGEEQQQTLEQVTTNTHAADIGGVSISETTAEPRKERENMNEPLSVKLSTPEMPHLGISENSSGYART